MAIEIKKLNSLIKKIGTTAAKQRAEIQEALIGCAVIAQRDRNTDPTIRLFAVVGTGVYRAGMSKWLSLNAPIHFVNGEPKLSSDRQKEKEIEVGYTIAQFEENIRAMPTWFDVDKENNKEPNVWDSVKFATNFKEYLHKAFEKAKTHDPVLAEAIEKAEARFIGELARCDVKEEAA
jgi:hypothetical protein